MLAARQVLLKQKEHLENNIQLNKTRRSNLIATDMALASEIESWSTQLDQVEEALKCLNSSQS